MDIPTSRVAAMMSRHMVDRVTLVDEAVTVWARGSEVVAATTTTATANVPALIREHAAGERVLPPGRRQSRELRVDVPAEVAGRELGAGWSVTVTACKFDPSLIGQVGTVSTIERPGPGVSRMVVEVGAGSD